MPALPDDPVTEPLRPSDETAAAAPRPSLSRNSAARFLAEGTSLVIGAVSASLTARWLGPSAKGTLAALTFASGLLSQACLLGLPEAAMVRVGRREVTRQQALSSNLAAGLIAAAFGAVVLLLYARAQLPWEERVVRDAVLTACAALPLAVSGTILLHILNTEERVVSSSAIFFSISATSALATIVLVGPLGMSVLGGAVAVLLGSAVGVTSAVALLRRDGMHFRPRLDGSYIRPALRYGLRVEMSYVLTVAAARLDLLVVYAMAGRAEAGIYSVALTFGTLSGTVATALAYAAFPRLPQLEDEEARDLMTRLVRVGLAAAVTVGAAVAVVLPVAIPLALGQEYAGAVVPALLLLAGGILWSAQWVISRSFAARGDASLLLSSFALNLGVMLALDLALIPAWGSTGAALASVVAPTLGFGVCWRRCRREGWTSLTEFVPRGQDFRALFVFVARPLRSAISH